MDQRDLQCFLAVAEHGTVSGAASSLYVSQPAVSRRVAALERTLGVRLFRRRASGMVLTPAGERLRTLAEDLRVRMQRADGVMEALRRGHQAFTVACPETTGNFFIAPFVARGAPIADVQPAHPGQVYSLLDLGADLAVNTFRPPAHLSSCHLATAPIFVHSPSGSVPPWFVNGEAEIADAAQHPMLLPGYGSAVEREVRETAMADGIDWALARTTSNGTMAQAMAAAGHGYAITIEPPAFGLQSALLTHRGRRLSIGLYAGWDPDHYAVEELAALATGLGNWMRDRVPQLISSAHLPAVSPDRR